jgi:EmrB/QacA subfamily drug resistance transporter
MSSPETRRTPVLPVVLMALALVVAAVPALNVALPSVAESTHASMSQLQWVVDAYALVFAGLLLPAGALGDRYGRKPVLVAGLLVFAVGAGLAALSRSPQALIGLRGLMGVGAALVMPTTLSIITTSFPKEQRGKAVGAWIGVAGAGAVLGLLTSGTLLEIWEWQSVFWFSSLLGLVVALLAIRLIPNSREANTPPVDYLGGLLSILALAGVVFGAIEGPERGWGDPLTLGAFTVGGVGLVAWVWWGLRTTNPLLDPRLFARRGFSSGVASIALQFFVFFGFIFLVVQYVQLVLGYSSLQAGLALIPMAVVLGGLSRRVPHLAARVSRRSLAAAGLGLMGLGMGILSQLGAGSSYWLLLAGIVPIGAGMALATAPATTDIVSAVPANKQGVASAVNDAAREVGGTLGIAILGSLLNQRYRSGVSDAAPADAPSGLVDAARESLAGALGIAGRLGEQGSSLAASARHAFVDGMDLAFLVSTGTLFALAVLFMVVTPGAKAQVRGEAAPTDADHTSLETASHAGAGRLPALSPTGVSTLE